MPVLSFRHDTMPKTHGEFVQLLEAARQNADPLDDLLSLNRQLLAWEQRYGMASSDFYARYRRGELGDELEFVRWAGRYRMYRELKEAISESLTMVLTERVAVPA